MTATVVQSVFGADFTPTTTAEKTVNGTVAGNSLLMLIRYPATRTLTGVTVAGQAVVVHTNPLISHHDMKHAYASVAALSSGGNKVVVAAFDDTVSGQAELWVLEVEWSVGPAESLFVVENSTNNTSANPSLLLNTTADNAVLMAAIETGGGGDSVAGSGFTGVNLGDLAFWSYAQYKADAGEAGPKTVDFVDDAAGWGMSAIAFQATAGDPPEDKYVTLRLVDATGAPRANLSGLHYALWDAANLNAIAGAPMVKGNDGTTDGDGVMIIESASITLDHEASALLAVMNGAGTLKWLGEVEVIDPGV